jgi:hypothetical protein
MRSAMKLRTVSVDPAGPAKRSNVQCDRKCEKEYTERREGESRAATAHRRGGHGRRAGMQQ